MRVRVPVVAIAVLMAFTAACGGGSSPTGPPATPSPPAPTPTPPPEPGFVLVRAAPISWPATDPSPQIGFEFSVPTAGDVLVELVDVAVVDQTTSTRITLSLYTEEAVGSGPQCVQFVTRCTGIANDEVTVALAGEARRLAATAMDAVAGPYFVMIGNWGPTGTVQGNLKAWFRAKSS